MIDVPDDCPLVEADRTQLQQLVMNLVINGGEAIGDEAGTLTRPGAGRSSSPSGGSGLAPKGSPS